MQGNCTEGITIEFLGDSSAFSRARRSTSYLISACGSKYLVDCGASVFQRLSGHQIPKIKGVLLTHAHDDHKRHFTDIALFKYYAPDIQGKLTLITTDPVHQAVRQSSTPAVSISLSSDSKRVVDIPYEDFVDVVVLGPRAKFRIREFEEVGEDRLFRPRVVDSEGTVLDPSQAKVVINPRTNRGRMLFRDPATGRWVDPDLFYPSNASCFYAAKERSLVDPSGLEISAVCNISWHGVPTTGFKFKTDNESLLITGDTVDNRELWQSLCQEVCTQRLGMPREEFEQAYVIYGDINDYIEQEWSRERYEQAIRDFENCVIVHEVAGRKSIVHTDYRVLNKTSLPRERVILSHSPDIIASEWILGTQGRRYRIIQNQIFEEVGDTIYPFNADIYCKNYAECSVGYRNPEGSYWVYARNGLLYISHGANPELGNPHYRVDMFRDIEGEYYPALESDKQQYRVRSDGHVEIVEIEPEGSRGTVVKGIRAQFLNR